MAEFIQLTHVEGTPLILRASLIYCVKLDSDKITRVEGCREPSVGYSYRVKESPAEVLALLAGEGKAEGIEDVVSALHRFTGPAKGDAEVLIEDKSNAVRITAGGLRKVLRLVAYFDGRKTDA